MVTLTYGETLVGRLEPILITKHVVGLSDKEIEHFKQVVRV